MKKNKFTEFFKGKGYYVLLFVGVLAIAAVALIGTTLTTDDGNQEENIVDLNEPDNNIAAGDSNNQVAENNNQTSGEVANNEQAGNTQNGTGAGQDVVDNDSLLEYDVYAEDEESGADLAEANAPAETAQATGTETASEQPEAVETTGKSVQANTAGLSFKADDGLRWPVDGNVIMNYSMDHTVYYATLMQFKTNPAIIIDAEVGTEVKAAAPGIVSSVNYNEETGWTVATDIGDGFSLVYGQLAEALPVEVGDKLDEGDVVGTIAQPTKYYIMEGSNLYFQVLEKNTTVNPMLYLK